MCIISIFEHFNDIIFYGKEDAVILEKVQTMSRTNGLTKSKDVKLYDSGKYLNISKGKGGSSGNRENSKSGQKSKYKCFKCDKTGHFKKDCHEWRDNGDFIQFLVSLEIDYEDIGTLGCHVGRRK